MGTDIFLICCMLCTSVKVKFRMKYKYEQNKHITTLTVIKHKQVVLGKWHYCYFIFYIFKVSVQSIHPTSEKREVHSKTKGSAVKEKITIN